MTEIDFVKYLANLHLAVVLLALFYDLQQIIYLGLMCILYYFHLPCFHDKTINHLSVRNRRRLFVVHSNKIEQKLRLTFLELMLDWCKWIDSHIKDGDTISNVLCFELLICRLANVRLNVLSLVHRTFRMKKRRRNVLGGIQKRFRPPKLRIVSNTRASIVTASLWIKSHVWYIDAWETLKIFQLGFLRFSTNKRRNVVDLLIILKHYAKTREAKTVG